jgi:hypothetical protein
MHNIDILFFKEKTQTIFLKWSGKWEKTTLLMAYELTHCDLKRHSVGFFQFDSDDTPDTDLHAVNLTG